MPTNTLGHFVARDDGYLGSVKTLALEAELRLAPHKGVGDKQPSHIVYSGDVECGAAWPAGDDGAVLNVKLDDPSWPQAMRARLVHGAGDDFLLLWRRPPPE